MLHENETSKRASLAQQMLRADSVRVPEPLTSISSLACSTHTKGEKQLSATGGTQALRLLRPAEMHATATNPCNQPGCCDMCSQQLEEALAAGGGRCSAPLKPIVVNQTKVAPPLPSEAWTLDDAVPVGASRRGSGSGVPPRSALDVGGLTLLNRPSLSKARQLDLLCWRERQKRASDAASRTRRKKRLQTMALMASPAAATKGPLQQSKCPVGRSGHRCERAEGGCAAKWSQTSSARIPARMDAAAATAPP
jgi:hypothetical protein